ncbi:MAG: FAD-dependent oxidoreductase [Actinomycetes bacterium]
MAVASRFDVIVVGGGIAGSLLAGSLARSGVAVLVAEKEARFRDRVRGEATYPWGAVEALRLGVSPLFEQAGGVELIGLGLYEERKLGPPHRWATDSVGGANEIGFSHPGLQEAAYAWASSQGATVCRPMKVSDFSHNGVATVTVTVTSDSREDELHAKLIVGADGKMSRARRWTGGESAADPEHHRFGGVAVSGVQTDDRDTDNVGGAAGFGVNWFAQGAESTRLYLMMSHEQLHARGIDRSFDALVAFAADYMPEGALDQVTQEGPIGFFSNHDTWATRIAGNDVVLIGDAAGSPDPTQGHGTSLVFRDVRELSDLLLASDDWPAAIQEFAERRARYFDVIRQYDLWCNVLEMEIGDNADLLREGHEWAKANDPTLGGFALIGACGPDGLVADAAARAMYFGEPLSQPPAPDESR